MKQLAITEEQMTFVIKEFLKQYNGFFDHVTFDEASNGYVVHFHQSPKRSPAEEPQAVESSSDSNSDDAVYRSPISIFHDFGLGGGGFGGFGGGSSGGAGASGGW